MQEMSGSAASQSVYTPEGWIIKACKYLNVPHSDYSEMETHFRKVYSGSSKADREVDRNIVFGNYDRIQVLPINTLAEFTKSSNEAYKWYGLNQSILLYHWQDKDLRHKGIFRSDRNGHIHIFGCDGQEEYRENQFFAVTFCYLSDWMRNHPQGNEFPELLNICDRQISKLVSEFNARLAVENEAIPQEKQKHSAVYAEVFGSLCSAELAILWSARQYTDLLYLVDTIRDFRYQMTDGAPECEKSFFRTAYTMISFPDATRKYLNSREKQHDSVLTSILGRAKILFVTQDNGSQSTCSKFSPFLNKCLDHVSEVLGESEDEKAPHPELQCCAGEYDLTATVESRYISRLFSNPLNWNYDGWTFPEDYATRDVEDLETANCICNGHNPFYNRYILYSSTRLTYESADLPEFTVTRTDDWANVLEQLIRYTPSPDKKHCQVSKRSSLIQKIGMPSHGAGDHDASGGGTKGSKKETEWEKYERIISLVQAKVPASSNLQAELQQLFGDYVQCCCSSADVLWIEDYIELFRQMLDHICDSVQMLDAWENYSEEYDEKEWSSAQNCVKGISELIRKFHQQTSHIITSNKLFFREQETHFGYTAQHDLVIHAYYDIIKHLIEFIYCKSNKETQSVLCPLVNFNPDDMINSYIFTEESALVYVQMGRHLRNRIMAIHIPQDGLDNLMYYLPMLAHETYHYSAPANRRDRNLLLAKYSVYHTLRYGFLTLLLKAIHSTGTWSTGLVTKTMEDRITIAAFRVIDKPLFELIEREQERIFAGIERVFFVGEINERWHKEMTETEMQALQKGTILRSWFLIWLKRWLCEDDEMESSEDDGRKDYYSLFDPRFLGMVFQTFSDAIADDLKSFGTPNTAEGLALRQSLCALESLLREAQESEEDELNKDVQEMWESVQEYVMHGDFQRLMDELDEIFPDIAMVKICGLSLEDYMLQTALHLDKQFRHCEEFPENYVRFGATMHFLAGDHAREASRQSLTVDDVELPKEAQEKFCVMYESAYRLATVASSFHDSNSANRALQWLSTFNGMYRSYLTAEGFESMTCSMAWIIQLIETQMLPCLSLEGEQEGALEKNRQDLFETPYHKYLDILKSGVDESAQRKLFELSLNTILRFQRYRTIRQMREEFEDKKADGLVLCPVSTNTPVISLNRGYVIHVPSAQHYLFMINQAVEKLRGFRRDEGLSTATGMWYRGVSNASYPILPSGFVHFAEDARRLHGDLKKCGEKYRYLDAQMHHYEAFRYSAEGSSPEVSPAQYKNTFNYLTLMQHYRQNTNLLDWSEDCFASTYFALEDEINVNNKYDYQQTPKKRDEDFKDRKADAVLYILDPIRFNKACEEIENRTTLFGASLLAEPYISSHVPNLSVEENHCLYREYHSLYHHRATGEGIIALTPTQEELDAGKTEHAVTLSDLCQRADLKLSNHLPRAVYAAKLNMRIRAQSGLFVAFSLHSLPAIWENKDIKTDGVDTSLFRYQALEEIQRYYLSMDDTLPFLMKIVIPRRLKDQLGKMFYDFGSSKERIYPELENHRNR